ncbi:MAG: YggS family pyridoxal phosphate-dependent enzyme [Clostridia bacterium]|nr:YggS family pyridoxal phosphate-dependent enzyme [Clostridia bacterium]
MLDFGYIEKNYTALLSDIERISARVGVPLPKLVAVTKSATDDELLALSRLGASDIGENRPQELKRKRELLLANGFSPRMHQIGTLQSNKVKIAAPISSLIHSLGSESLALEISRRSEILGRAIPVLIEVNSGEEPQKDGVMPRDAERFLEYCMSLTGLEVKGLMTMGPAAADGEELRPYYRNTKKLFDTLSWRYGFGDDPVLSMGMSDSYGVAIEEGSTLVRVGRRLFLK